MPFEPLRILVILPMYGGSLPIGRYCASALGKMGHTVRLFEAPLFHPCFAGLRHMDLPSAQIAPLERSFLQIMGQVIWAQVQSLEPHLVIAAAQAPVGRNLLQRLRRAGIRTAMWFVEDFRVFPYWRDYAPLYDVFAVIQKEPFLSALADVGQPHALYLPLAALPDFHRPLHLSPAERKEYGSDISFLGAGYPNRRLAFRPLIGRDFKIWGSDWDGESLLADHIQREGTRISEDESVKIYNASKININLHSSIRAEDLVSAGDFVNPRTFELAAMQAFQLVDKRSLMADLFAPDEMATFETIEDFYTAIDHYLLHPEEREILAKRARTRVLREHTYERRMESLLKYIEDTFGAWMEKGVQGEGKSVFDDLDPILHKDLPQLLKKLELGPHASFEDVLIRLRGQQGTLNDLESTLLFLEAWRHQYCK